MNRRGRLAGAGSRARQSSPSRRSPQPAPDVLDVAPALQGPVRTCVGCRARDLRSSLLRVVVTGASAGDPQLVLDEDARMPGRGAWLHPDLDCLQLADRRRAFGRALRSSGSLDTDALRVRLTALMDRRAGAEQDEPPQDERAHDVQGQDGPDPRVEPR
ncbi:MAG: YlxR family protein [Actinobacteria bacterium]|nr:YlxR family protein [Actinomycetota bacterium]